MSHAHALHEAQADSNDVLGFWLYIMTDCILFASLFATYFVLHHPNAYGPALKPLIDLKYVLVETGFLLASNFSFGMSILSSYRDNRRAVIGFLMLTFMLGACFVGMEVYEFLHLAREGYNPTVSGAASAFFTLVGTHGLHVSFGLLWIAIMIIQLPIMGLNRITKKRLTYLGLFWNFLDIVWIFVFTFVYLMGAL